MTSWTYAGVPLAKLPDLPDDARRRLLHRLEADCAEAATRNRRILRDRRVRRLEAILDAIPQDPPRVVSLRRLRLLDATTPKRPTRRTA